MAKTEGARGYGGGQRLRRGPEAAEEIAGMWDGARNMNYVGD